MTYSTSAFAGRLMACLASMLLSTGAAQGEEAKPAVSGLNVKLAVAGGAVGDDDAFLMDGALTVPVTHSVGLQIDGLVGAVDGDGVGGGAAHLFWRDPDVALAGLYVSGLANTSGVNYQVANVGVEGELYLDQFSIEALVGAQFSNVRDTEVIGSAILAFYPVDDVRLYAGGRHWFGRNEAALGAEWQLPGQSDPSLAYAVFADGRLHEDESSFLLGVRVYFGDDKPLIRRHREDDPATRLTVDLLMAENRSQGPTGTTTQSAPQPPTEVTTPPPPPVKTCRCRKPAIR
ncbi:MAG: hypothetical protein AAGI03_16185, partial [Pseudomonadota bacterium]